MKNFYYAMILGMILFMLQSCETEVTISENCSYYAIVEDHSGLDGCGYLFKLESGEYLEPVWRWGFCGTPPLPEGATEDPLYDYDFNHGERVRIGFRYSESASMCMKGSPAIITCIESLEEVMIE